MLKRRSPNPFQRFAAEIEPVKDDDEYPFERWWPPTPASTLRNRKRRARLSQAKHRRDPSSVIGVLLHESEIDAIALVVKSTQPSERHAPITRPDWHDSIADTVRRFVVAELKARKLI